MQRKLTITLSIILMALIVSGCDFRNDNNETQIKINQLEETAKKQQEEIEKLKSNENQQNNDEYLTMREDCERRVKAAQDELDSSEAKLLKDQNRLNEFVAGTCEGCYNDCHRQLKEKGKCEGIRDDSVNSTKSTVASDKKAIQEKEITLTNIKNECNQYLSK
ncbi:MAG: hypothetical protein ACD_15C00137G0004 [uncultured bacterium]|nr:MAG: hypothetical protein ACD_15C00137G0004 [uncultured bacterium]